MDLVIHLYVETSRGLLRSGALDRVITRGILICFMDLVIGPLIWTWIMDIM